MFAKTKAKIQQQFKTNNIQFGTLHAQNVSILPEKRFEKDTGVMLI